MEFYVIQVLSLIFLWDISQSASFKGCRDNGEILPHPTDQCSYVVCSYAASYNGHYGNNIVPVPRRCAPGTSVDTYEFDPYNPCSVTSDYCKPEFEIRYVGKLPYDGYKGKETSKRQGQLNDIEEDVKVIYKRDSDLREAKARDQRKGFAPRKHDKDQDGKYDKHADRKYNKYEDRKYDSIDDGNYDKQDIGIHDKHKDGKYDEYADGKFDDYEEGKYKYADGKFDDYEDGKYKYEDGRYKKEKGKYDKSKKGKYDKYEEEKYDKYTDGKYDDYEDQKHSPRYVDDKHYKLGDGRYDDYKGRKYGRNEDGKSKYGSEKYDRYNVKKNAKNEDLEDKEEKATKVSFTQPRRKLTTYAPKQERNEFVTKNDKFDSYNVKDSNEDEDIKRADDRQRDYEYKYVPNSVYHKTEYHGEQYKDIDDTKGIGMVWPGQSSSVKESNNRKYKSIPKQEEKHSRRVKSHLRQPDDEKVRTRYVDTDNYRYNQKKATKSPKYEKSADFTSKKQKYDYTEPKEYSFVNFDGFDKTLNHKDTSRQHPKDYYYYSNSPKISSEESNRVKFDVNKYQTYNGF